jgi:hypothetical protein
MFRATLAARVFRFLVALIAAFGLKVFQYNFLNAFRNAEDNCKIYVQTPEGYVNQFGPLLQLWQVLYGLKKALLLLYNNLCASLKDMGLKPVPGIPCLFMNKKLIVFFYVDNIVVLVRPEDLKAHQGVQACTWELIRDTLPRQAQLVLGHLLCTQWRARKSLTVTGLVHWQGCGQLQAAEEIRTIPSNSAQQGILCSKWGRTEHRVYKGDSEPHWLTGVYLMYY